MKLCKDGITRNTDSKVLQDELKRAGYVEVVEEPAPKPEPPKADAEPPADKKPAAPKNAARNDG